jgi:hypothetical protein
MVTSTEVRAKEKRQPLRIHSESGRDAWPFPLPLLHPSVLEELETEKGGSGNQIGEFKF